jgi:hypothetical protein
MNTNLIIGIGVSISVMVLYCCALLQFIWVALFDLVAFIKARDSMTMRGITIPKSGPLPRCYFKRSRANDVWTKITEQEYAALYGADSTHEYKKSDP